METNTPSDGSQTASPNPGRALSRLRWCAACSLGELAGLGGAFAILALWRAAGADAFDPATPPLIRSGLGLLVGTVEGGILGAAQALALRRQVPGLSVWRLAGATAVPAALVWALVLALQGQTGAGPQAPAAGPPLPVILAVSALGGLSGGVLIGACQSVALALRTGWPKARLWVAASATGWAAGLAVIMTITTLQDAATPPALVALLAASGAALGGLALGLGSYWGARQLG